ncbi:hypothetical protein CHINAEXTREME_14075 [Halobiforma lacisalsi AJ5]|uniref:DUF8059 domain-containing protein n=2 Tax=Natronobacterium lacisalsi TaxID=229731 RepID=M0LFH7_NATLA|nr:hypothetical protein CHINAEXTREME_14075 [Halobiforma lacisalsi AJ5]EMA32337.1 hypothetical protein C445_11417 [Halobiforma lacisalsi AJ5]
MMSVGMYQNVLNATGEGVPGWLIGGHAHLGVLSIIAIVLGVAIPTLGMADRYRTLVTWTFIPGQWGLPLVPWLAVGGGLEVLHPTAFLSGGLLIVSMLVLTWQAAVAPEAEPGERGDPESIVADD